MRKLLTAILMTALIVGTARADSAWLRLAKSLGQARETANRKADLAAEAAAQFTLDAPTSPTAAPLPAPSVMDEGAAVPARSLQHVRSNPEWMQIIREGQRDALGLEMEQPEAEPTGDLFDQPEVRRLLGEQPRFIYDINERPDPMMVPWIRAAVVFKDLEKLALSLMEQERLGEARQIYRLMLEIDDARVQAHAEAGLAAILDRERALAAANEREVMIEEVVELPPWVVENTTGVVISHTQNMALVGDYLLRVGDHLPNFPQVYVAEIADQSVTYELRGHTFDVELIKE